VRNRRERERDKRERKGVRRIGRGSVSLFPQTRLAKRMARPMRATSAIKISHTKRILTCREALSSSSIRILFCRQNWAEGQLGLGSVSLADQDQRWDT
jgi:hypothetical protein